MTQTNKLTKIEYNLAKTLQELVDLICAEEREVTVEDCNEAKKQLSLITGSDWYEEIPN